MPKVKNIEKKIWEVEDFNIQIRYNGKDVHGAKQGLLQYPFQNSAKNDMSVSDWKRLRFNKSYPGYEVIIFNGDGEEITAGQTKLGTVRDTYIEDEG